LKVTDKFTFTNKSIEFAAGLAFHEDRLLVTLGVMDCYSYVSSLSFSDVQAALRPPRV
jgi:hypothetical protein